MKANSSRTFIELTLRDKQTLRCNNINNNQIAMAVVERWLSTTEQPDLDGTKVNMPWRRDKLYGGVPPEPTLPRSIPTLNYRLSYEKLT